MNALRSVLWSIEYQPKTVKVESKISTKLSSLSLAMYATRASLKPRFTSQLIPSLQTVRNVTSGGTFQYIISTSPRPGVGQITLNRPNAHNALNTPLIIELNRALRNFDSSKDVRAVVITGNEKAFAAGADVKEMKDLDFSTVFGQDFIKNWSDITAITIPIIAAVNGVALGGGCELAMMADILYCGPNAKFGQPEIKLGVIPGSGGSQRLTRTVGKAKAMELILTGKTFSAEQAEAWGLVAEVFETSEKCISGALDTAETIAGYGQLAVKAAKEVVNQSLETGLSEGVKYERRVFHALFGSKDQKIGMSAFAEKRQPEWHNC